MIASQLNLPASDSITTSYLVSSLHNSGPVTSNSSARIIGLDCIRGFALLGILLLNIVDFAWPNQAYNSVTALYYTTDSVGPIPPPEKESSKKDSSAWMSLDYPMPNLKPSYPSGEVRVAAVASWWDVVEWALADVFFANKMRTLFCILFGAGTIYLTNRSLKSGNRPVWLYYRRTLILLLFGTVHAYLIWEGDILFLYAAVALYLYPFRRLSASTLLWISLCLFLLFVSLIWTGAGIIHHIFQHGAALERKILAEANQAVLLEPAANHNLLQSRKLLLAKRKSLVEQLPFVDKTILKTYRSLNKKGQTQQPERLTYTIRLYSQGSYPAMVSDRAQELFYAHLAMVSPLGFLFIGWLMLIGMSLAKTGFFAGDWPSSSYRYWAFRLVPLCWVLESALLLLSRKLPAIHPLNMCLIMPLQQAIIPVLSLGYASGLVLAIKKAA